MPPIFLKRYVQGTGKNSCRTGFKVKSDIVAGSVHREINGEGEMNMCKVNSSCSEFLSKETKYGKIKSRSKRFKYL